MAITTSGGPGRPTRLAIDTDGAGGVRPPTEGSDPFVRVVVVPPAVGRCSWVARGRVLPLFLAAQRGHVEVAPCAPHVLVAAGVDEVRAVDLAVVADERVRAVPFADAEVRVE